MNTDDSTVYAVYTDKPVALRITGLLRHMANHLIELPYLDMLSIRDKSDSVKPAETVGVRGLRVT